MQTEPTEEQEGRKRYWLDRLAELLSSTDQLTAERAALRRMDPRDPGRAHLALARIEAYCGVPSGIPGERVALIVHALALARGRHSPRRSVGEALHAMNYSEERLCQLLSADADVLFDLVPRLARRFASGGHAVDWWPLVNLVRFAGIDEERADEARQIIARSYVSAGLKTEDKKEG